MSTPGTPRPSLILPRASHSHSQSGVVGLSSDHAAATVSSHRRRDFVFVVNPSGTNGRTGKQWKQLLPHLRIRLVDQCNICESITFGKEVQSVHLIEGLAIQWCSLIPLGTGSDFARTFGWTSVATPEHVEEAFRLFNVSTVDAARSRINEHLNLSPEIASEIKQGEAQIKRRMGIGSHISERRLIDELTRVEYKRERHVIV